LQRLALAKRQTKNGVDVAVAVCGFLRAASPRDCFGVDEVVVWEGPSAGRGVGEQPIWASSGNGGNHDARRRTQR